MKEEEEKIYEMMWDCEFCGQKNLLGITHRFCPACGATQNPDKRYFPPEDKKVAVQDHEFVGADKVCSACSTALSANIKFCTQCGSPTDGTKDVKLKQDPEVVQSQKDDAAAKVKKDQQAAKIGKYIIGIAAILLVSIGLCIFWKKDVSATVVNHTWQRTIEIEKYQKVNENSWCDQVPASAKVYKTKKEVKSNKKVENGQECKKVKKDKGDGSYAESKECKTKYKEIPVYAKKCYYKIKRWKLKRTAKKSGGLNKPPVWPKVKLKKKGNCLGCERTGKRNQVYTLHLKADGKSHTCEYNSPGPWRAKPANSKWKTKVGVMSGSLDCSSLKK